jgi:hypothetical protein
LLGQGAYHPSVQRLIGLLIVAATLLGLAAWPLTRADLRLLPVVPALALAAWAVLDGARVGGVGAGPALLLVGVVAVLVVLGRLIASPGSVPLAVAAAGLLAGMAATMSRAGALALVVGLGMLAGLRGLRATAWAAVGPVRRRLTLVLLGGVLLLTGTGPGHATPRWKGQDHGTQLFTYVHNEYLQVTAELGLVGLGLLAILLAAIARLLQVTVTQRSGSGATQGFGFTQVGCTGSGQQVTVLVQAVGAKAFKKGTAAATAEVFGCTNVTCGSETDREVIEIQR